jgi:hypothetical protein
LQVPLHGGERVLAFPERRNRHQAKLASAIRSTIGIVGFAGSNAELLLEIRRIDG